MRKRAGKLSAILILLCGALSLAACGARQEPEPFKPLHIQAAFAECPRPARPEAPLLDENVHVGSINVLEPLMRAVDTQGAYIDALETALDCYEQRRNLNQ